MAFAVTIASFAAEVFAWVVAPARCAACDVLVTPLSVFCAPCASTSERMQQNDASCTAGFVYGGAVARAIVRLKYDRRPDLARPLGDLLWRALQSNSTRLRGCRVVPIPLHVSRLAERGFNQSALIARRVAHRLDAPLLPLALVRTRDTPRQAALDREARIANVAGAFRVRQGERVRGRAVLLIDDVRTTGATMNACARALMDAGAASVGQAVVACVRAGGT
jgi:ComF family protein